MYFLDGKLGAYERMMTQKPRFHRDSHNRKSKDIPVKKIEPSKPASTPITKDEGKGNKNNG